MTPALDALRAHLLAGAPDHAHLADDTIHLHPACAAATTTPRRVSSCTLVARALQRPVRKCERCRGEAPPWWAAHLAATSTRLPSNTIHHPGLRAPSAPRARSLATPAWLDQQQATAPACCASLPAGSTAWSSALAVHTHDELTTLAAGHGPPTTWLAIARRLHLQRPTPDLEAPSDLDPLTHLHPWASATSPRGGLGVTVIHTPASLAGAALAAGATQLDPDHVQPATWHLARRLILEAFNTSEQSSLTAREQHLLPLVPDLFAVAHAATH